MKDLRYNISPIGVIHTPYIDMAPFLQDKKIKGDFKIEVFEEYARALDQLDKFSHIIVLFYFDRNKQTKLTAHPPKLDGKVKVGIFASRSPYRPNHIGINILELFKIEKNILYTSHMDILENTPLIDIKPYIKDNDCIVDANRGWLPE